MFITSVYFQVSHPSCHKQNKENKELFEIFY